MGIPESNLWIYCKKNYLDIEDTSVHALIECQAHTTKIWLKTVHSTLNCRTFEELRREEILFGTYDKTVNMMGVRGEMYIYETIGQETPFILKLY